MQIIVDFHGIFKSLYYYIQCVYNRLKQPPDALNDVLPLSCDKEAYGLKRGVKSLSRVLLQEEVWESYLNTGEMQVHDTGHVETHTQHQQQQHQHPPERGETRVRRASPVFH